MPAIFHALAADAKENCSRQGPQQGTPKPVAPPSAAPAAPCQKPFWLMMDRLLASRALGSEAMCCHERLAETEATVAGRNLGVGEDFEALLAQPARKPLK